MTPVDPSILHPSTPSTGESEGPLDPEVYRQAVEVAPIPLIVVRDGGSVAFVNRAAVELFGYPASALVGKPVEVLIPEVLRPRHRAYRDEFEKDPSTRRMGLRRDLVAIARDGREVLVEVGLSPVHTPDGMLVICAILDITARKRNEEELSELATLLGKKNEALLDLVATDSLTSLSSRRAFMEHLASQVEISVRHARSFSVLLLDIDYFKSYNDTFGHLAGDEVLRQFGRILRETARRSDFVARLGGEEFGIILPETDRAGARTLGERFRTAIEGADWPRRPIRTSVGAMTVEFEKAVPRPRPPESSEILSEADRALYHSKNEGRNRVTHVADVPLPGR